MVRSLIFTLSFLPVIFAHRQQTNNEDNSDWDNPYRHAETLDKDGKYLLEWLVDWKESRVIFNVTVQTKGYVGFGLSRRGKMSGADIVIGGVLPNGQSYFSDRYAVGNHLPVEDESQDWVLHEAWESGSHTFLKFSRAFETCDEDHDLPIQDDVLGLLWAYGETDSEINYHYQNRGVFYAYLLDPDLTPRELAETKLSSKYAVSSSRFGDWKVWSLSESQVMPAKDTTYLCGIHKTPPESQKQHIVGFRKVFPSELEEKHIHHFLLHRCIPPVGQDPSKVFEHLLGYKEECYVLPQPEGRIPTDYCIEVVHVSAVGQRPNFFPDHVGIPMQPNEYFMFQVHYDNPLLIPNITLNYALEIFYTGNLRAHDAGVIAMIGALIPASPTIMIPPNSVSHEIYGHCSGECTKSMIPSTGIRAFAGMLHTHMAGRGVRRIHIRDGKELPWLLSDDNYNFDHQQFRLLREERLILPGDTIIERCVYDNTDRDGNVTVGGFRTRNEMCSGFIWYFKKLENFAWCASELRSKIYKNFLQIANTTWSNSRIENVITSPQENAGLMVSEVGNLRMNWTLSNRRKLQEYHRFLPQISICPPLTIYENETVLDNDFSFRSKREISLDEGKFYSSHARLRATSSLSGRSKRQSGNVNLEDDEIQNPEWEFASVYPEDIVSYTRPNACA